MVGAEPTWETLWGPVVLDAVPGRVLEVWLYEARRNVFSEDDAVSAKASRAIKRYKSWMRYEFDEGLSG